MPITYLVPGLVTVAHSAETVFVTGDDNDDDEYLDGCRGELEV